MDQSRPFKRQRRNDGQAEGREASQAAAWLTEEEEFVLRQKEHGAVIRVKENRGQPVDVLVVNLRLYHPMDRKDAIEDFEDEEQEMSVPMPSQVVERLTSVEEINKTLNDIQEYVDLENKKSGDKKSRDFWQIMLAVFKEKKDNDLLKVDDDPESRVIEPVSEDINNVLQDRSLKDLELLQTKVNTMLESNDPSVDHDFWSQLLKELQLRKARAQLKDIESLVLTARRGKLAKVQEKIALREKLKIGNKVSNAPIAFESIEYTPEMDEVKKNECPSVTNPLQKIKWVDFYSQLERERENIVGKSFIPMTRYKRMEAKRRLSDTEESNTGMTNSADTLQEFYDKQAAEARDDGEEAFEDEEASYAGSSKGIQKPRYFNRVLMGFDWNKYNQTHYTSENPPPKNVQGYKFNIFYPELVNSSLAPTYKIINEGGPNDKETCIIVFKAPEIYQDIAFRIVNKPWDKSSFRRGGFVNKFENGVLQLHFRFKKVFYRK